MNKVFSYERCLFIRPNVAYVDPMVDMMNNEEISSMLSVKKRTFTREMEIGWINKHQEDNTFCVLDANTLEYIGNCGFNEIDNNRGEIGLTIVKNMQGRHYAKKIIKGLIDYGFNKLGLDEIYVIVFSDNVRSLNCVTQLGFQEYKREENVIQRNGVPVDDVYLKLKK